jgi:hypothetical protein
VSLRVLGVDRRATWWRPRSRRSRVEPRQAAPIDLAGYWVSPIIEDWKYRMVTPTKGVFDAVPLTPKDARWETAGIPRKTKRRENSAAYGAGGIMRLPGRLRISWQDDTTMKVETDTGTQTRVFHFGDSPAPAEATWQGHSIAQWNVPARSLKVVTTHLRPGYVRKNGAPYGERAVITEYWELNAMPNGDRWLTVISKVEDPQYFTRPYTTSSDFKKLPDAAGWSPTPCSAK